PQAAVEFGELREDIAGERELERVGLDEHERLFVSGGVGHSWKCSSLDDGFLVSVSLWKTSRNGSCVAFPEAAVDVALDGGLAFGAFEALEGEAAVVTVAFDGDERAVEFAGDDGGCAGAQEWVEDDVAVAGAGKDELGDELFRLLCGVR